MSNARRNAKLIPGIIAALAGFLFVSYPVFAEAQNFYTATIIKRTVSAAFSFESEALAVRAVWCTWNNWNRTAARIQHIVGGRSLNYNPRIFTGTAPSACPDKAHRLLRHKFDDARPVATSAQVFRLGTALKHNPTQRDDLATLAEIASGQHFRASMVVRAEAFQQLKGGAFDVLRTLDLNNRARKENVRLFLAMTNGLFSEDHDDREMALLLLSELMAGPATGTPGQLTALAGLTHAYLLYSAMEPTMIDPAWKDMVVTILRTSAPAAIKRFDNQWITVVVNLYYKTNDPEIMKIAASALAVLPKYENISALWKRVELARRNPTREAIEDVLQATLEGLRNVELPNPFGADLRLTEVSSKLLSWPEEQPPAVRLERLAAESELPRFFRIYFLALRMAPIPGELLLRHSQAWIASYADLKTKDLFPQTLEPESMTEVARVHYSAVTALLAELLRSGLGGVVWDVFQPLCNIVMERIYVRVGLKGVANSGMQVGWFDLIRQYPTGYQFFNVIAHELTHLLTHQAETGSLTISGSDETDSFTGELVADLGGYALWEILSMPERIAGVRALYQHHHVDVFRERVHGTSNECHEGARAALEEMFQYAEANGIALHFRNLLLFSLQWIELNRKLIPPSLRFEYLQIALQKHVKGELPEPERSPNRLPAKDGPRTVYRWTFPTDASPRPLATSA